MNDKDTISELREENELLLLQLHQVQEELEHYYLEYKKSQASPAAVLDRPGNGASAPSSTTTELPMTLLSKLRGRRTSIAKQPDLSELINASPAYKQLEARLQHTSTRLADLQNQLELATQSQLTAERQIAQLSSERDARAEQRTEKAARLTEL
nr:hypothetical protein [Gammaproteobacteria bacterium]